MRKPLPIIHEDMVSLKQRVQHEHNGRKQPRLQMLYWLARPPRTTSPNATYGPPSSPAKSVSAVNRMPGRILAAC